MKKILNYKQLDTFTSDKKSFEYPTISYVEENNEIYYKEKPIILHFEIKDDEQLQNINSSIEDMGNKLPLLTRSDLIQEAKLDGNDITSQLHQGEPHVFTGTTAEDKMNELMSLFMNESGFTDYVITVDGPFSVGNSWDLEIKFKDGITDCIGLFGQSFALNEIPENLFSNCTDVIDFNYVFGACIGLASIPNNLFFNNAKVINFSYAFTSCVRLINIPNNLFINCHNVDNFQGTFYQCTALTGNVPVDNDGTPIYNRSGEGKEEYAIVTNSMSCFGNCTGLTYYSSIPNEWK